MRTILPVILMVLLVVISLAFILGISLGVGWVLTLLLPFSLFEGTLLGMIAVLASGMVWYTVFRSVPVLEFEEEEDGISESRFWQTSGERTWENWFRYVLADSIYEDVVESRGWMGGMDERQQQEQSIQLADAALGVLKRRARQAKGLRVTRRMLRQELVKAGRGPYEDELLDVAVAAVNVELVHLEEELREVARGQMWDEPAEVY